jgi:hypothetical protein
VKLCVHELTGSGLTQELIADRNVNVVAIRPHIYKHNAPAGTLKVKILDASDVEIAESDAVTITNISGQPFYHGYVRFYINAYLKRDETYKIKLVGEGGYSFNESAYVGWCNDYDSAKYDTDYVVAHAVVRPLDLEIWERK